MSFVVVQSNNKVAVGNTTITWPVAPTEGNLLVVQVGNAGSTTAVTQTGATYTQINSTPVNHWWAIAEAGADTVVSITVTSAAGVAVAITEYASDDPNVVSFDDLSSGSASGNSAAPRSGSINTSGVEQLVVAAVAHAGTGAQTNTSTMTAITDQTTANNVRMVTYRELVPYTDTDAHQATTTISPGTIWFGSIASFQESYDPPSIPTNFFPEDEATDQEPTEMILNWDASSYTRPHTTVYYYVYFGTDPDDLELVGNFISDTFQAVETLVAHTTYYWRVDTSSADGFITGPTLSFSTKTAVHYDVYTSASPLGPWTKYNEDPIVDNPSGNSYTLSSLTIGAIYYIMVVAGKYDEDDNFVYLSSQTLQVGANPGLDFGNPHLISVKAIRYTDTQEGALGCQVTMTLAP